MTEQIKTVHGMAWPADLIGELRTTPERVATVSRGVSNDELDQAEHGGWSARTILAHLRDDEFMVKRLHLERIITEETPMLATFDEKVWATNRWTGRDALLNLTTDFRLQREASVAILERLTESEWMREAVQTNIGAYDLLWWVEHWASHDRDHIEQLQRALGR